MLGPAASLDGSRTGPRAGAGEFPAILGFRV